jgi:hypothetical protein
MELPVLLWLGRERLRRVLTWCAAGAFLTGLMSARGPAVVHGVPRPGPFDTVQVAADDRGERVLDAQVALKMPTSDGGFVATGKVRFSRLLCEATYTVLFTYTANDGRSHTFPYPARLRSGRLDGVADPCPFAGLPRRSLESMRVSVTVEGLPLLEFRAWPSTRHSGPTAWLKVRKLRFRRSNVPHAPLRFVIRARYRAHRSHTVAFTSDLPRN